MDMGLNGYLDEQLDLMGDGLFDNIEEFFNFSNDVDEVEPSGVDSASLSAKMTDSPPANANASVDVALNGDGSRVSPISDDQMCGELNISDDWITKFLDDDTNLLEDSTFHETDFNTTKPVHVQAIDVKAIDVNNEYIIKDESLFQSLSPVSVLEPGNNDNKDIISSSSSSSSSSFSSSITTNNHEADTFSVVATVGPTAMLVPARARSKRPRRAAIPILPPEVPPAIPTLLPECESFTDESCPVLNLPLKKKTKKVLPAMTATVNQEEASLVRKCLHCGIQKTPQWRAGPMGPKTLCNACGVRYKSGRLFPEYRPAASPTFMPSIHSNSHKKVVEMRNKACQKKAASGMPLPEYPAAKNCDLLEYIRRRD